jgi:hypothetical protein
MKKMLALALIVLSQSALSQSRDYSSIVGKYAHYDVVSYIGKLFGPINLKSRIISFGITEFYVKDGKLMTKDRFCFSDYEANIPFKSLTSDEFTRAIIPPEVQMEVMETNGELLFHRPETPTLLGVSLKHYTENFPKDPMDPSFIDADKDGKPGVTVNLVMGKFFSEELYIARKEIFSYDVKRWKNGILSGVVRDRSQQYIIGASKENLVKANNPIQNMDLQKSPIYLIPMKQDLNCDQLKAQRHKYFPNKDKRHRKFYRKLDISGL